jgi:hypothetical protein
MAYRNPAFLASNRVAVAGAAAITSSSLAATAPKERLVDGRISRNAQFAASAANQYFEVDLGSALSCDRLVIPVGHNLSGCSVELRGGASPAPAGVVDSFTAGSGLIDRSFGAASHRYWRLVFVTSGQWAIGEWVLGDYQQTSSGVVTPWRAPVFETVLEDAFPTREAVIALAPARRELSIEHRMLESADLAIYDAVIAQGRSVAFWHWPVDDALGPMLMRLSSDPERDQDSPNPKATGPRYRVALRMREQAS